MLQHYRRVSAVSIAGLDISDAIVLGLTLFSECLRIRCNNELLRSRIIAEHDPAGQPPDGGDYK